MTAAVAAPSRPPLALAAGGLALALAVGYSPLVAVPFWSPKYALLPLVAALGLPRLVPLWRDPATRWAAVAAGAFALLATASTLAAEHPVLAAVGLYGAGSGLVLVLATVGAWALGRSLEGRGPEVLARALLAAVVLNAAVAVLQTAVDLSSLRLGLFEGIRAAGLLGNPVHLAAVLAGGLALTALRHHRRPALMAPVVVLAAAGLEVSGSRFGLAVGAAAGLWLLARRHLRALGVFAACFAAGLGLGLAAASAGDVTTSTERAEAGVAGGGGGRTESWWTARHAVAERPLLGAGPGRYQEATSPHRTPSLARSVGADRLFVDAHDLPVELAVTVGLPGAAAALAWLALALRGAGGPLAGFALGVLALHLLQPQSAGTTPVALMALGAAGAGMRPRPGRGVALASGGLAVLALVAGGALLAGDFSLRQADLDFELEDARLADTLLPPWPEPAEMRSRLHLFRSNLGGRQPDQEEAALRWRREAARRDPAAPRWWYELAELEAALNRPGEAARHFRRALAVNPVSVRARVGLARLALDGGRPAEAAAVLAEALPLTGDQDRGAVESLLARARGDGA